MAAARELLLHRAQGNSAPARPRAAPRVVGATATLSVPRRHRCHNKRHELSGRKIPSIRPRAAVGGGTGGDEVEDGVVLGTLKLPGNTDLQRFETLLFQWANSLSQGAGAPLPVPLKVDRVKGGARLGFSTINDDGTVEVSVYIDCLVFPAEDVDSPGVPVFRAIRNGPLRGEAAPGEPRIMRSLLQALQTSVEIAKV